MELSWQCHAAYMAGRDTAVMKNSMTSRAMNPTHVTTSPRSPAVVTLPLTAPAQAKPRFEARFVSTPAQLREAQRLRAQTFGAEYGIDFSASNGLDRDRYDSHCQHLNVYDVANGDRLIATTRLLSAEGAARAGGFYSAQEFDLSAIERLPGRVLEIGRTCVHPDYRSGAAIMVLWSALSEHLLAEGFQYLIGCASISLADGGTTLASVMPTLREKHFVGDELRVSPSREILLSSQTAGKVSVPPLLKAYLRMGARIGGEACWDPEFNCADVFILLDVQALAGRYAQKFLRTA